MSAIAINETTVMAQIDRWARGKTRGEIMLAQSAMFQAACRAGAAQDHETCNVALNAWDRLQANKV